MSQQEQLQVHSVGDRVNLIFSLFDDNEDGKICKAELKRVMQALDQKTWTDKACDHLWSAVDHNNDGHVQFTEFWSWICGHGVKNKQGKAAGNPLQDVLLRMAIQREETRLAAKQERRREFEMARMQQAKEAEERETIEAERIAGKRINQKNFEEQYEKLGLQKDTVRDLFRSADDDGNGELDLDELGVMAANQVATVDQIKGLVCRNAENGSTDPEFISQLVDVFSKWDADGSGTISSTELAHVIRVLNPELTEKTVTRMISEADADGNGDVDIFEFFSWLSGKPKKKKAQEEQEAAVLATTHRSRCQEAFATGKGLQFEEMQRAHLAQWCEKKKIPLSCNTINKHSPKCRTCKGHHGWFCHGCGFVMFSTDCVHGCSPDEFAWTCLFGTCCGKKCGCKKKPDVWRRTGFAMDPVRVSWSVSQQLKVFMDNPG